eukprot:TRINITY_DN11972_c0_g2_i1.p1 TRINITY_DN11972_c0_g2~~TRINITY_DN11972_c0_g2_i1.p1  ORF type:complete len:500 (+),score=77.50 TRINITY_DN11972_c0_g2_i1:162-1502(+)
MGDKMWEFIIPLALIDVAPHTLLPAALFGTVVTGVRVLFGTSMGRLIDTKKRMTMIQWGIGGQLFSVTASSFCLYYLMSMAENKTMKSNLSNNIFYYTDSILLTTALMISAAIGSICANIMDLAIERDWVPTAITQEQYLTVTNTRMRQVDLVTEIGGPFLAGVVPLIPHVSLTYSFTIIAGFNFITFIPQYLLLWHVYHTISPLRAAKRPREEDNTCFCLRDWNPLVNIFRGWTLYIAQPVALASLAMTCLWLTILSPHDVVFTAYLNAVGYNSLELGLFRGIGALVGFAGTFAFPRFVPRFGLEKTSWFYIIEEGLLLSAAAVVFTIGKVIPSLSETTGAAINYVFLVFLLLSRLGLYGFEVGEISIMQQGVPEDIRGIVNSVESSLTSLASLLVFLGGFILSNPDQFIYLVWVSTFFVVLGAVLFTIWYFKYGTNGKAGYQKL